MGLGYVDSVNHDDFRHGHHLFRCVLYRHRNRHRAVSRDSTLEEFIADFRSFVEQNFFIHQMLPISDPTTRQAANTKNVDFRVETGYLFKEALIKVTGAFP